MKVVYVCGYDGNECAKYKVKLDENGNIIEQEINCTLRECDRCHFIGNPWARVELQK